MLDRLASLLAAAKQFYCPGIVRVVPQQKS